MGTSDVEFSLLVSAFSLNSTWTPLLGGVLTSRLGTTTSSIIATSVILSGTRHYPIQGKRQQVVTGQALASSLPVT